MKKILVFGLVFLLAISFAVAGGKAKDNGNDKCTTIQSGELEASDGSVITTGFDEWGYNYQAHLFNGGYCDAYRDADWCQSDRDTDLKMKWNDAWLSNKDCDGDGKLDRHYGYDSYIGSGAWVTNHMSGSYKELMLYEKDPSDWSVVEGASGEMTFTENTFDFEAQGLDERDYTLIRYTEPWPGNVTCLADGTTDGSGKISLSGEMLEGGEKIWLVSSEDVDCSDEKMIGWEPKEYLFENNLVSDLETCSWDYFTKIVAVPEDAELEDGFWYTADGTEIGPSIWGHFAKIQEVENDPCAGVNGKQYVSPTSAGLGYYK